MASWDVNPSVVNQVVDEARSAADDIATALDGTSDGATLGVGAVELDVSAKAQSSLIATAIQTYFEDRQAAISQVMYRIAGVMNATVNACNAIEAGHDQMAEAIQAQVAAACQSGDFTDLLPAS